MRRILIHFRAADPLDVAHYLDSIAYGGRFPAHGDWFFPNVDNPFLYISLCEAFAPPDSAEFHAALAALGGQRTMTLAVDVSDRFLGRSEALFFAVKTLSQFEAVAKDPYTPHHWTLQELNAHARYDGLGFFDSAGWAQRNPAT